MEDLQRINVKFHLQDPNSLSSDAAFRIFNTWITESSEEVLVDVADYNHVGHGPITLLIGHEANYSLDNSHSEPGLLYSRKQPVEGHLAARLKSALENTLKACQRLEAEPSLEGKIKFRGGDILIIANDRLNAPNDEAGESALCTALEPVLTKLFAGTEYTIERDDDDRLRLNLRVRAKTDTDTATLLGNLAA